MRKKASSTERSLLRVGEPEGKRNRSCQTKEGKKQDGSISTILGDAHLVAYLLGKASARSTALRAHPALFLLFKRKATT